MEVTTPSSGGIAVSRCDAVDGHHTPPGVPQTNPTNSDCAEDEHSKLTMPQLKSYLLLFNLSVSGKKQELLQRIRRHYAANGDGAAAAAGNTQRAKIKQAAQPKPAGKRWHDVRSDGATVGNLKRQRLAAKPLDSEASLSRAMVALGAAASAAAIPAAGELEITEDCSPSSSLEFLLQAMDCQARAPTPELLLQQQGEARGLLLAAHCQAPQGWLGGQIIREALI